LGELLEVVPVPVPLPSRLSALHVEKVRDLTRRLSEAASTSRSDPEMSSAAAAWASRLLDVPGSEPVTRAAQDVPRDEHRAVVVGETGRAALQAVVEEESATAYARLGCPEAADTPMAKARQLWTPTPADPYGDLDRPAACRELERGHLDAAEPFAVASMRRWEGDSPVSRTQSAIVLATVYVRAGEPRGLALAERVVTAAGKLTSVRARRRLEPLASALDTRPGADPRQLARTARQVATTVV